MTQPDVSYSNSLKLRIPQPAFPGRFGGVARALLLGVLLIASQGCGSDAPAGTDGVRGGARQGGGSRGGGFAGPGGFGAGPAERGVPVEVAAVTRSPISLFFETQGTLEAEQEVDLLARAAGPVVALSAEEGQRVSKGQLLARIDDRELRAQLDVAKVRLDETKLTYERAKQLSSSGLVSQETVDQALASYQSAQSDFERLRVQLQYTEVRAPFGGLVVNRYVKFAQTLSVNSPIFRISDFDPLLCPIQVPERELPRLSVGQPAQIEVEAWPEERFAAKVLRVSPVVDSESGTFKVTLEVKGDRLRPGMFASVYLEMETRDNALVIPKQALALDSLENSVFVVEDGVAQRRGLELGFQNSDLLEVTSGLSEGEQVVIIGQDNLSEGTPVDIPGASPAGPTGADGDQSTHTEASGGSAADRPGGTGGRGGFGGEDLDLGDPEQVKKIRQRMKERGLSEDEIDQRIARMKERSQ